METLQRTANRGSVSTGYDVTNSLKLEENNDEQLERSPDNGNRRTWTFSTWFKMIDSKTDVGYVLQTFGVNNQATRISVDPGNNFSLQVDLCDTGTDLYRTITNRQFRDVSAWYHVVVAVDTTQGTDSNRLKIYVNGVQETSFSQTQYPTQNLDTLANVTGYGNEAIATFPWAGASYDGMFCGYIAEHILIDGQQLTPTSFGEFDSTGIWKPKDPSSLTFGTNGHYLKFDNSSSLGADSSGNSNNYTTYNITAADQATDTPTNNFCTLNINWKYNNVPSVANCIDGGTLIQHNGSWSGAKATMGVQNGKWYWEIKVGQNENTMWGVQTDGEDNIATGNAQNNKSTSVFYPQAATGGYRIDYISGSATAHDGTATFSAGFSSGDVAGVLLDMDNNEISFYKNGSSMGTGFVDIGLQDNANKLNFPFMATYREYLKINFGGYSDWETGGNSDANGYGSFQYSVPSGYYALCTKNLAEFG